MWVTENSVIHIDPAARSMLMTEFSDPPMWTTEFSVTNKGQWEIHDIRCVTIGFFTVQLLGCIFISLLVPIQGRQGGKA
jgi:hypothetical protein